MKRELRSISNYDHTRCIAHGEIIWKVTTGAYKVHTVALDTLLVTEEMSNLMPMARLNEGPNGAVHETAGDLWTISNIGFDRDDSGSSGPPHDLRIRIVRLSGGAIDYNLYIHWSVIALHDILPGK